MCGAWFIVLYNMNICILVAQYKMKNAFGFWFAVSKFKVGDMMQYFPENKN